MDVIFEALSIVCTPASLLMMLVGGIMGLILGAIPGLSGGLALVVLLPLTYTMNKYMAMTTLMSIYIGGLSGAFIGSILLGIPGTAGSLATTYDGYPLTQKGEAARALSVGMVCNFLGTGPSIILAMFASTLIAGYAVKLGPFEYFAMGFLAISLVASLSKGNLLKGFISAGLGLLVYCVGTSPVSSTLRFTFGSRYLFSGFDTVSVLIGIMALTLICMDYAMGRKGVSGVDVKVGRFKWPGHDLRMNITNIIRSFIMGLGIGFLPGMGAGLSNISAYAVAKSSSGHPEEFGKGCIDGVIAPEVANNASQGGAIIPMIALGIPGDASTALLISALTMQGLEVGPLLETNEPVLVKVIFIAALLTGLMVLLVNMIGMPLFPKLLEIPYHFLYPSILMLCLIGSYISTFNMFNVFMTLGFLLFGLWFQYAGFPPSPFFLSFILGKLLETNLRKGISYSSNGIWGIFTRPISCVLVVITIVLIVIQVFNAVRDTFQKNRRI